MDSVFFLLTLIQYITLRKLTITKIGSTSAMVLTKYRLILTVESIIEIALLFFHFS